MKRAVWCSLLAGASLLLCACDLNFGSSGLYAPPPPAPNLTDPPSRAARLSYLEGMVSFRPSGSSQWIPAVPNRPLTSGDELWTDAGARAEVQLGSAAIRMDSKTYFGILELSDEAFQAQLIDGTIAVRVRRIEAGDAFEIDTPNASVSPLEAGEYRVSVNPKGDATDVTARTGGIEVTNAKRAFEIAANQRAHVNRVRLERATTNAPSTDAFDRFCEDRDAREARAESGKYVSSAIIGAADLDGYGVWQTSPELGPYWKPKHVNPDWAPYRFGRWAWTESWGWAWIDDAPWGFAPFHYGRWTELEGSWVWAPGKSRASPAFAPALVVFLNARKPESQFSRWLEKAGVAWLPLSPDEIYLPANRLTRGYVLRLNAPVQRASGINQTAFAAQTYANRSAITAVSRDVFVSGQPVAASKAQMDPRDAGTLSCTGTSPALAPIFRSLSALAARGIVAAEPPAPDAQRQVIVRRTPLYSAVPFEQQLPLLREHPGRPLDRETLEQLRNINQLPGSEQER